MSKYFRIFKFSEDNLVKKAIYNIEDQVGYIYYAQVFLKDFINTSYDFRAKNMFIATGWGDRANYPHINFYRSNFYFENLKGRWCSIIVNDISMESKSYVLEELYNELGNLENPEEDQIACYTFLINRITNV